jgi:ribosomal protein S11
MINIIKSVVDEKEKSHPLFIDMSKNRKTLEIPQEKETFDTGRRNLVFPKKERNYTYFSYNCKKPLGFTKKARQDFIKQRKNWRHPGATLSLFKKVTGEQGYLGKNPKPEYVARARKWKRSGKFKIFNCGYIFIHTTKRNSFVTLTDNKFEVLTVRSVGSLGSVDSSVKYKGKKKNSAPAKEEVAKAVVGKALEVGRRIFSVIFKLRERVNYSYLPFIKGFVKRKLLIKNFKWRNPTAHGYVRFRKKRRI